MWSSRVLSHDGAVIQKIKPITHEKCCGRVSVQVAVHARPGIWWVLHWNWLDCEMFALELNRCFQELVIEVHLALMSLAAARRSSLTETSANASGGSSYSS